jgi:hypothetical protein
VTIFINAVCGRLFNFNNYCHMPFSFFSSSLGS